MNKKGNNKNTFITYLLITFVIICGIFRFKTVFIEPNNVLSVSISTLLYPFTFLFVILINKKSNFSETHKVIIKTALVFVLFNLLISVFNTIPGTYFSRDIDLALKQVLTPNYFLIGNTPIYYPNLVSVISFTLLFYFSHTLLLILYEAMEPYVPKVSAFLLSMFIPFALDTLCYVTLNDTISLIEFTNMIQNLTSNFVLVIISTLLMSFIYFINLKIDKQ